MIEIIYSKEYLDLIDKARKRGWTKKVANEQGIYVEGHHIIPKCIAPELEKDKDNIIFLTAQEHYYAHKYLAENNIEIDGLTEAWWRFMYGNKYQKENVIYSMEDYEAAKILHAKNTSILFKNKKQSDEHIEKRIAPLRGRTHKCYLTNEQLKERSIEMSGSNNPFYGKSFKEDYPNSYQQMIDNQPNSKRIKCNETGEIFKSISEASRKLNCNRCSIQRHLKENKKNKHVNGYTFCYVLVGE